MSSAPTVATARWSGFIASGRASGLGRAPATINPRRLGAWALGRSASPSNAVTDALIEALADHAPRVRRSAAESLGLLKADAVDALVDVLKEDAFIRVRMAAVVALGRLGPAANRALPDVIEATTDHVDRMRQVAVTALGHIGGPGTPAVPALIDRLKDEKFFVRVMAARALGHIGDRSPAVRQALRGAVGDDHPAVRDAAQAAHDSLD